MQRQQVAENDDLAALGPLRQRRGDQIGRRHQAIDVLVMLVEHHAVEPDLVGIGELVDIFLIEAAASLRVPQAVRHRHPAGLVSLVEIGGQIRIGHESASNRAGPAWSCSAPGRDTPRPEVLPRRRPAQATPACLQPPRAAASGSKCKRKPRRRSDEVDAAKDRMGARITLDRTHPLDAAPGVPPRRYG
jgi:hypothetical protein